MVKIAQISLYVDDSLISKLHDAANRQNTSVSKYVSGVLSDYFTEVETEEARKKELLKSLWGAIPDPTFIRQPQIPWGLDVPRRYDLLDDPPPRH